MSKLQCTNRSRLLLSAVCSLCLLFTLHAAAVSQEPAQNAANADQGFVPLFNGKDLSGWQTTGSWVYEPDGTLSVKPASRRRRLIPDYQSFLWSTKMYDNFVLDLELKVTRNGNSGVLMRSVNPRLPRPTRPQQ
jgi:hypothetical protein